MTTSLNNLSEGCRSSYSEGVPNLTFDNYASLNESVYIVKAVGEILLEIKRWVMDINPCDNDIKEVTERNSPRKVLEHVVPSAKRQADYKAGSPGRNEMPSNKICFTVQKLSNRRRDNSLRTVSSLGRVYNANRIRLNICDFVTSFYKHYPLISYSSFILSLIYIDRFIKAKWAGDLSGLSKFSIKR